MKRAIIIVLIGFALGPEARAAQQGWYSAPALEVELEGGFLWQTVNDVQIPNSAEGTRFSLVDLAGKGPYPAGRLYITWNINEKHGLRLLLAPFSVTEEVMPPAGISFEGEDFAKGTPLDATYKFNSWRMSYRYAFHRGERATWRIGFTAKIRDAKIELSEPGKSSSKTDLGFVPLLHISTDIKLSPGWLISADIDALAGGPGRAVDFSLKLGYLLNRRLLLSAGYRTLEGGADVDEVYNFAWLHYAVFSVTYRYR